MKTIRKYSDLIIGLLIESLGFTLFLDPNNLVATDVTGLSVIFNRFYHINTSLFILIGNLILLLVSLIFLGKKSTINSILGSLFLPLFIFILSPLTSIIHLENVDMLVIAVVGGIISGAGMGLVFKSGFTSGGTDILEEIFCKYGKVSLAKSMMLIDGFVVIAGGLSFGVEPMIYSILALTMMSVYSNRKYIGVNEDKLLLISTKKKKLIIDYINNNYLYGTTILDGVGAYSKKESDFIMCSVSSKNYYRIKTDVKKLEPDAFIVILDSYDTNYMDKENRKRLKKNKSWY